MLLKKHIKCPWNIGKKFIGSPEDFSIEMCFPWEAYGVKSVKTPWTFLTHCFLSSNFILAL